MTRVRLEALIGDGVFTNANGEITHWNDLTEAARVEYVKSFGAVPSECGDDIIPAVARGVVRPVQLDRAYLRGDGEIETMPAGHKRRKTMVVADVFDRMNAQAMKKKRRLRLTAAQVNMGRIYARVFERHSAGAVRCSSIEGRSGGGGGSGDGFTDARLASSRQIDVWHRRIGSGPALDVKRVRKLRPGKVHRVAISARQLVDGVCIEDMEISKVLRRYGWASDGATITRCCLALGAVLDRMAGPSPRGSIRSMRPELPDGFWGR